jgi:hypothetical protein
VKNNGEKGKNATSNGDGEKSRNATSNGHSPAPSSTRPVQPLRGPLAARARYRKKLAASRPAVAPSEHAVAAVDIQSQGAFLQEASNTVQIAQMHAVASSVALTTGMLDPSSVANLQGASNEEQSLAPKPIFVVADCTGEHACQLDMRSPNGHMCLHMSAHIAHDPTTAKYLGSNVRPRGQQERHVSRHSGAHACGM